MSCKYLNKNNINHESQYNSRNAMCLRKLRTLILPLILTTVVTGVLLGSKLWWHDLVGITS